MPGSAVSGSLAGEGSLSQKTGMRVFFECSHSAYRRAHVGRGMNDTATFSLFVRRLPPGRGFLVAAGLESCLRFLEDVRFAEPDLAYLRDELGFRPEDVEAFASGGGVPGLRLGRERRHERLILRRAILRRCVAMAVSPRAAAAVPLRDLHQPFSATN